MLSKRLPAVPSSTRSFRRANAARLPLYHRATGASARRGLAVRIVSCSTALLESPGETQSSGSPPNDRPGQGKPTGGAGDPQGGGGKEPGWWQAAIQTVLPAWPFIFIMAALLGSVTGVVASCSGLATTAALTESEGRVTKHLDDSERRVTKHVDDSERRVTKHVDDSEGRVTKHVDDIEGRMKERVDNVQKSVDGLHALVIGQVIVGVFTTGLCVALLVVVRGK